MIKGDDLRSRFRTDYTGATRNQIKISSDKIAKIPSDPNMEKVAIEQSRSVNSIKPEKTIKTQPKKSKRNLLILVVLLLIACGAFGGYLYYSGLPKDPFTQEIKKNFKLDLVYPGKLPADFRLDERSVILSGQILNYQAGNSKGDKIVFTIQEKPPTFDFKTFYQVGLSGTEQFNTNLGQGAVGKSEDSYLGSLVTDESWVLIRTDSKEINGTHLKLIITDLRSAN